jgi:2'-5' RNA ligase
MEASMAVVRTFIAVEMPEALIARLRTLQEALRAAGPGVAWVRPEGMHVTLKFLGDVAEEALPEIYQAMETATAQAPFNLRVTGAGAFPTPRRPKTVWAGIDEGAEPLAQLAAAVEDALAALGFPREERPFRPHITLGRVKDPRGPQRLGELIAAHAGDVLGAMPVTEIVVMRSDLTPQGARYTPLRHVPLGR